MDNAWGTGLLDWGSRGISLCERVTVVTLDPQKCNATATLSCNSLQVYHHSGDIFGYPGQQRTLSGGTAYNIEYFLLHQTIIDSILYVINVLTTYQIHCTACAFS